MKFSNVHIILIRQFREALLLLYFLVSQFLEALSVLSGGLESKSIGQQSATLLFSQRGVNHKSPFNPCFEANLQCGQSFERFRSCEISMDLHAWIAADKVVVQSGEYWRSLRTSLFSSLGCFKHPQNGKIKQTSWSTFSFWKLYFQHVCRLRFLRTSWDELNKFWIISSMRSWIHTRVIISQHHWLRLLAPLAPTPSLPG